MWMRCRRRWAPVGIELVVRVPQAGAHVLSQETGVTGPKESWWRDHHPEVGRMGTPSCWGHEENQRPTEKHRDRKIQGLQDRTGGQRCDLKIASKTSFTDWQKTVDCSVGKVLAVRSACQQLQGGQQQQAKIHW